MLKVRLFGSGQADYCGRYMAGFPNQQAHMLLCYLLLNKRHPHHRERLASIFWMDHPTRSTRKYLRNALWRLRQSLFAVGARLEDYLFVCEDSIAFINSSPHWLDVEVFEQTVNACLDRYEADLSPKQASDLEFAVDLYIGDMLDSVYDDWCLYDRERLRLLYLSALNRLMAYYSLHQDYHLGLGCGERLLALDNTQERVHRQMMWLYWQQGDRGSAVTQYRHCCQILHQELGIPPMHETQVIYDQIVAGQAPPSRDSLAFPNQVAGSLIDSQEPDNSPQSLIQYALSKLHRLQHTIDETRAELHQIESIISQSLNESG
jgi:DNA-binding SARP family transcriptional activator